MPRRTGQFGSTWQILHFSWSGSLLRPSWSKRQPSRDPPAMGTYHGDSPPPYESSSPSSPCLVQEQGKPWAQIPKESQLLLHLCQPENHDHLTSEWKTCQRVGSSFRRWNKPTAHFIYYIKCDCVQFADTLMMVSMYGIFGIWLSQDGMK